jgi:hypothetical protein
MHVREIDRLNGRVHVHVFACCFKALGSGGNTENLVQWRAIRRGKRGTATTGTHIPRNTHHTRVHLQANSVSVGGGHPSAFSVSKSKSQPAEAEDSLGFTVPKQNRANRESYRRRAATTSAGSIASRVESPSCAIPDVLIRHAVHAHSERDDLLCCLSHRLRLRLVCGGANCFALRILTPYYVCHHRVLWWPRFVWQRQ